MSTGKRSLVLTVDYEVFGNGGGDVRRHVTAPTERMARICDRHGVPLTIFFEVEEYLSFQTHRSTLVAGLDYDPAAEIRAQLIDLVRRGHDLQLHLHPEWVGAALTLADGVTTWHLNRQRCTVDSLFTGVTETARYIAERKAVVDELFAAAGSKERVTAYRAGAFCAQPGKLLLHALEQNGFVIDSSAVKGMTRQDAHASLDFRSAPVARRHWNVRNDVAVEDPTGSIIEVPIYSKMGRRYHQLTPKRLLAKFSDSVPADKRREMVGQLKIGRTPASVAKFLLQRFPTKLDFHNMSAGQMLQWIRSAPAAPAGDVDALVLIGHSKEHRDDRDFERFLAAVTRDPALEVISMSTLARRLRSAAQTRAWARHLASTV